MDAAELIETAIERYWILAGNTEPLLNPNAEFPAYDHLYVVHIYNTILADLDVRVKEIPALGKKQGSLIRNDLKFAETNGTAVQHQGGSQLDWKLQSKVGAIVIFNIVDPLVTFQDGATHDDATNAIQKEIGGKNVLVRPRWVGGSPGSRKAVSVLLKGGEGKVLYTLKIKTADKWCGNLIESSIDPKIENDGGG